MTTIPAYLLNDGNSIPAIGLGTAPLKGDEAVEAIGAGIQAGYRLLDSAVNYQNEDALGTAVARSGVAREEIVVTTKVPGRHHGYDETLASFEESRARLGLDYVDLYLIHWPNPSVDKYVDSWRAMVELQRDGLVKSIGVSNFTEDFLNRLRDETGVLPAVNQVELHPYFPQAELRAFHETNGIRTESWSPLGNGSDVLSTATVTEIAGAHGVSPAQAVLRWHVQLGAVPLPRSRDAERRRQNFDVFGFDLSADEVAAITALGRADGRLFDGDPLTHEEQ
jgi:2,5-diketo-D-gluconate reductase A